MQNVRTANFVLTVFGVHCVHIRDHELEKSMRFEHRLQFSKNDGTDAQLEMKLENKVCL